MDYRDKFIVKPGQRLRLNEIDPSYKGHHETADAAVAETDRYRSKLSRLQSLLYAEKRRSVLIVLQALDAGGKDGLIKHVFATFNPQGARVIGFKKPTEAELAHDFLWRIHPHAPAKGEIVIFNRSHYEDVLITRVHKLIDKAVWTARYDRIREFEKSLAETAPQSSNSSCTSARTSSFPALPTGSKTRRTPGRSAPPIMRSARSGTTTSPPLKTR